MIQTLLQTVNNSILFDETPFSESRSDSVIFVRGKPEKTL